MIESMLVCGLMAYYHVDCIQFYFYDNPYGGYPWPHTDFTFGADEDIEAGIGIIHIYNSNSKLKDACGNSILEHELQRFHQKRFDFMFCNDWKHHK